MISLSFTNLLVGGVAALTLAMLWKVWLSEKARRSVERARARHMLSEREFADAHRRERGDD